MAESEIAYLKRGATDTLTYDEKAVYVALTERVTWENNFVKNAEGSRMSISEIAMAIGRSRPFVNTQIYNLQEKNLLRVVSAGRGKLSCVYLYSEFYWFGRRGRNNDDALVRVVDSLEEDLYKS